MTVVQWEINLLNGSFLPEMSRGSCSVGVVIAYWGRARILLEMDAHVFHFQVGIFFLETCSWSLRGDALASRPYKGW